MTNAVSFLDLFRKDSETGARILKYPSDLRGLFERVHGIEFEKSMPSEDAPKNSQADYNTALKLNDEPGQPLKLQREIIFTCQIGVSACQDYIALQHAIYHYQR